MNTLQPLSWRAKQEAQIYYSTATFRTLLDSLARPGKINVLSYPAAWGEAPSYLSTFAGSQAAPLNMYALGALLTLLDSEVKFAIAANGHWLDQTAEAVRWLTLRSGAAVATAAPTADFAFFCDGHSGGLLDELNPGSLLEPELGATAIYCVQNLVTATDATLNLTLSGPGIDGTGSLAVIGLAAQEISLIQATRRNYPLGVDIFLIDDHGNCVGLPRTTKIVNSR